MEPDTTHVSDGEDDAPLRGLRVVEVASLAAAPFACMVLADLGAEVLRLDRASSVGRRQPRVDVLARGRPSVGIDLKQPEATEVVLDLAANSDVLVEGFRPGVAERLGFGPEAVLRRNPRVIYGRLTGWGQTGPLRRAAGHDLNYVALSGALEPMGFEDRPPPPPLNLVGDFAGGGMLLLVGILAALYERSFSGRGQVIDAAMVDGASLLSTMIHGERAAGHWLDERGANPLDGGAHFYSTYETEDRRFISIGPVEPQFYRELLELIGADASELPPQEDRASWPAMKARLAAIFRTRTREEWCDVLEGTDACFAPVLSPAEVADHPHHRARRSFMELDGITQPAPAPRFSRSRIDAPSGVRRPGQDTRRALQRWGIEDERVQRLLARGVLAEA